MRHHVKDYQIKCDCDPDDWKDARCPHEVAAEHDALYALVDDFAKAMKKKLHAKLNRGQHGWDDESWTKEQILASLKKHVEKGDPVDIANLAAFLWNRQ